MTAETGQLVSGRLYCKLHTGRYANREPDTIELPVYEGIRANTHTAVRIGETPMPLESRRYARMS